MHEVRVERVVDVPLERAWSIVDDFGGVYRYHPAVERSPVRNGPESGLGAERVCHFDDGNAITERITAYEPGRAYTVEIVDLGRFPLKSAEARIWVSRAGDAKTRIGFDMRFLPKGGLLGWLMANAVMKGQFRKVLGQILEGVETHARTGEVVSRKRTSAAA